MIKRVANIERWSWLPAVPVAAPIGIVLSVGVYLGSLLAFNQLAQSGGTIGTLAGAMGLAAFPLVPMFGTIRLYRCLRWKRIVGPWCDCGYNLTGNVSGICPECGRPI